MLGGYIIVLDCVVTHACAASYAQGVSQLAGFAAAKIETKTHCAFKLFGDGAGILIRAVGL